MRAGCVRYSAFTTGHKSSPRAGGQRGGKKEGDKQGAALTFYRGHRQKTQAWSLDKMYLASYFCFMEQKIIIIKASHSTAASQDKDQTETMSAGETAKMQDSYGERKGASTVGVWAVPPGWLLGEWSNLPIKTLSTKRWGCLNPRNMPVRTNVWQRSEWQERRGNREELRHGLQHWAMRKLAQCLTLCIYCRA